MSDSDSVNEVNHEAVQKLKNDVRKYREAIHRNRMKCDGILPGQLVSHNIRGSYKQGLVEDIYDIEGKKDVVCSDYLIISMDSTFLVVWRVWLTFCCLTSCYFYAYMAAMGVP